MNYNMANLKSLGKLLGVGEEYAEQALAKKAPKVVPGQDMMSAFRPPKVSDLGTDKMSADELKSLYNQYLGQGAGQSDARMQQLMSIIGQKERVVGRNAAQLAEAKSSTLGDAAKAKALQSLAGVSNAKADEPNAPWANMSPEMQAHAQQLESEDKPLEEPAVDPIDFIPNPLGKVGKLKGLSKFIK